LKDPLTPITVCIFDLDDTLYDCFGQRVLAAHRHASEAMVAAGLQASVEEVLRARMEAFQRDPRLGYIDAAVCRRFHSADPEKVTRAAYQAFFSAPVGSLTLFPGTLPVLRELKARGVTNFVVTFGDPATQRLKVSALGLDREPSIESIQYADIGNTLTKEDAFRAVLRQTGAQPAQVLVAGDRPSREIRAGKSLGMRTVRIRHGEFAALQPQGREEQPDYEIASLDSLLRLPLQFGRT
jgi:FMN phosphatase YigB (HAD superfamily)